MQSLWTELRKIPMLALALAVAIGIAVALHVDLRPQLLFWLCAAFFGISVVSVVATRLSAVWMVGMLLFLGALGAYRASLLLDREVRAQLVAWCESKDSVTVAGRVYLPASDSPQQNCIVLSACVIRRDSVALSLWNSRIRVYADSAVLSRLRYGDRIYAAGRLSSGREMYSTRGSLIGSLVRREVGSVYADSTTIFAAAAGGVSVRRIVDGLRAYSRHVFGLYLSRDGAALCKALLLGDRGEFGQDFTNNLRITGLSHIFALSGMNTGLIVLVIWIGISWPPIPHSARLWILLASVMLYMEVGREAPSLVRASLAAGSMIVGHLLHRRAVFLNLILAAMFLELLWKPLDIVDAGFLLSYLAVFGIVGGYTWLRQFFLQFWVRPVALAKVAANVAAGTVSAQIGTLPMVGYLFHRVPLTGVIGNLMVVPGFAFLLILAVLLLVLHPILPWIAQPVSSAIDAVSWGLAAVVNFSARIPLASLTVAPFSLWILLALCTAAGVLFLGLALRRTSWVVLGALVAGNVLVWGGTFARSTPPKCEVTFIDVENGDATLISADRRNVLVDAGPAYGSWSASRRILPVLAERRINRIDALVLTHPDNDHIGGAAELLLEVPVDQIYTNGEDGWSRTALEVDLAAAQRGKSMQPLSAGEILNVAPGVSLTVLSPDSARLADEGTDNEKSLVMRLDADGLSMLLPADIDSAVESELAAWGRGTDVDLIKSPHHGARRSTSNALLAMTTPEVCVISSGRRNPFGHPAPEVLARLKAHHVKVHNTAREGTMTFVACNGGWKQTHSDTENLARQWKLIR
jgi:competence protein ComEC